MGRFNEMLSQGAELYPRGLAAALGLEEQPGVRTVAPEVMPTFSFGTPHELFGLLGPSMWGVISGLAAGGAGNRSQMAIENPANSGRLLMLDRIYFFTSVDENLTAAISQTPLTTSTGNLVERDLRWARTAGGSGGHVARLRTQINAALANVASNVGGIRSLAARPMALQLDCVLPPSWSFRIFANADNTAINSNVVFFARERAAPARELTGF